MAAVCVHTFQKDRLPSIFSAHAPTVFACLKNSQAHRLTPVADSESSPRHLHACELLLQRLHTESPWTVCTCQTQLFTVPVSFRVILQHSPPPPPERCTQA